MAVIRRVWWSETRPGLETRGAGIKAGTEVTLSLWAPYPLLKGRRGQTICLFVLPSLHKGCVTGRNRVLFIRVIESKCPGPTLSWTAVHRVNSFLHAQRGSGGREAEQSCRREPDLSSAVWRFTSTGLSLKTQTVISSLQTSIQDLLDFLPSLSALARRTQLSASRLHFVKPPVAPIVLVNPKPSFEAWRQSNCHTPILSSTAFPKRMLRTCGGIGPAHTPPRMHKCCRGVCEVWKLPVLRLRPKFHFLTFNCITRAVFLHGLNQVGSHFGFGIDPNPDLGRFCFDGNHWRTDLPVLTPCRPSTCRTCRHLRELKESVHTL